MPKRDAATGRFLGHKFAAESGMRLTGDWRKLQTLLVVAQFNRRLRVHMKRATRTNALLLRKEIRANISEAKYAKSRAPNAELTRFIKGSSKPLVDKPGGLFQSITSVVIDPFRAEVGVKKQARGAQAAIIVHEGAQVNVTPKMRGMFAALADASQGRRDPGSLRGRARELFERRSEGWKALKPGTTVIRIPRRPFIEEVVESNDVRKIIAQNWLQGAAGALIDRRLKFQTSV